jgi:PAS domain S-box-containing protein
MIIALASAASFFVLGQALLRPKFDRLQREHVASLLHDVNNRVEDEVSVVDATAQQNSNWSGLYDVMAHNARPFLTENIGDTAAQSAGLSLDLMAYDNGKVAFESTFNWDTGRTDIHPVVAPTQNLRDIPFLRSAFSGKVTTGTFKLAGRVVAVSARPIVRSDGSGRGRGIVVFARELDKAWMQDASNDLDVTVGVQPYAVADASSRASVHGDTVRGTSTLSGVGGVPVAVLSVQTSAALSDLARQTVLKLTLFATLVIVVGSAVLIIAVQRVARRQSDRFQSVVQNAKDVILLSDKHGTITYASPSSLTVFGHRPGELVGTPLEDWVHPDDGFDPEFAAWRAPDGADAQLMLRFRRADGTWALCEANRANMLDEPAMKSVVLNLHDITERARASDEIVQARDEAVRAMNVKSQFLASMSHEIRTPLNGVLGLTELLLSTPLDGEQVQYATSAHSAAESLLAIVNDILDFSKIEAGKLGIEDVQLDARAVVEDVAALMTPQAQAKGLTLEVEVDPGLPVDVRGDPLRLRQVLLNLAANAVKFTDAGCVTIAARVITANDERVSMDFQVADTGIGISANDQSRIFGAFAQADSSVTRRYGGTGLGLAISRELVRAMGGELRVQSEVGCGSTFAFDITLTKNISDARTNTPQAPAREAGEDGRAFVGRVLLVEDIQVNQLVATRMLTKLGFDVDVVANGVEALDILTSNQYLLVFMDCQMPVMDGYEATRQLRRRERDLGSVTPVRVIAMTAAAMEGDRERCLRAGMDDYITKPLTLATLRAMASRWIAQLPEPSPPVEAAVPALASDLAVDPNRLEELRALDTGDGMLFERLIASFFDSANAQIGRLRDAVREGNPEGVERAAHALKGSSGNVGATHLAEHAATLERLARGRALGEAGAILRALDAEMERVSEALLEALKT